jgi:glucose/arabinose dehydrogenase
MRIQWWIAPLVAAVIALAAPAAASALNLPPGFSEQTVLGGLNLPTAVRFSSDGRVFVAEKSGLIKVFSSLSATTPTVYADLRSKVYDYSDRGLLGLALHPNFPTVNSVYVLYTVDAPPGGTPPTTNDTCADPNGVGCLASGRLSRLDGNGNETVLIHDWCQQYTSHSVGSLAFGPDGMLYASGGDGASYNFVDWGQNGNPFNPCGDPPGSVGTALSPPTAEGGALRSQDLRTLSDPVGLNGAILRLDPATGAAAPGNPLSSSADANARRIIAYGLRNPFRFTFRPGSSEIWAGDVGWNDWEEINRIPDVADASVENFGWPCYEGAGRQAGYDNANLNICETLYGQPNAATGPYFTYKHTNPVVQNEACPIGGSSIAGLAFQFYTGSAYPAEYNGALFFADYSRNCVWAMQGGGGLPSPSNIKVFVGGASGPVDLQMGPGGDLYYVSISTGTIRRIHYTQAVNQPPTAAATATPTDGDAPLTVSFDGTGSRDPEGGALTYAWDLDADGAFDDSTAAKPTWTYTANGKVTASLRVADPQGSTATASVTIGVGRPKVTIDTPTAALQYAAGDTINFSGHATAADGTTIPPSGLSWDVVLNHCSSVGSCHDHFLQSALAGASGSFQAIDHEWPSFLVLKLKATDANGLEGTASVRIDPKTTELTLATEPAGLKLELNGAAVTTTPFKRTVIVNSLNTLSAPSPQTLKGRLKFVRWSDGNTSPTRQIKAGTSPTTYTAIYQK